MNAFWHAVAFLTRFPVPVRLKSEGWEKSAMWYPVVGVGLGAFLAVIDFLVARWFSPPLRALIDTAVWIFMTGGLHLDGLMDTADGFGSHRDRERMLAIMKDSRIGAMGMIAGVLLILFKAAAVWTLAQGPASLFRSVLVVACALGRMGAVWGIFFFPYIREDGIGVGMKEHLTWIRMLFAWICCLLPAVILLGWPGVVLSVVALLVSGGIGLVAKRRIGGCTGDLYGAMIELTEVCLLLILSLRGVEKWFV
ncbi:adenosylcobinamide-GDP ribazoletransferase [Thermoactinomyces sp. CICC 10522]|uniref:adenosylcobinamide-GDP ribazoletransferase n=1 Tax=Thermoactinomyces sp. CICC 10522 TaxID=2767427 RepID=UPI0018DC1597|nr:adenosylcobinamide-GDP ribazoletransferase [Thermoactinomyces sp. CICC 10522]MBH8602658.1 adenosylcobinamide-GDP ribazoletransferase [Thermoactinomyces sp. CICC 10522]